MIGMKKNDLCLLPHDPAWKEDFLTEKRRILNVLKDESVKIEHVGSTSITNVHAKPILDIAILCGKKGLEPVIKVLLELDYEYRGQFDENTGHHYAVFEREDIRFCQAHIYTDAKDDWLIKLLFRDILCQNTELAREYSDYKIKLAKSVASKNEYAEIKTRWVDNFLHKVMKAKVSS